MSENNSKIIIGTERLANFLGVSRPTISTYVKMGMPGNIIGGKWHFHLDLVNDWFKNKCYAQYKGDKEPEDLENDAENMN